jgi:hypothetical protein
VKLVDENIFRLSRLKQRERSKDKKEARASYARTFRSWTWEAWQTRRYVYCSWNENTLPTCVHSRSLYQSFKTVAARTFTHQSRYSQAIACNRARPLVSFFLQRVIFAFVLYMLLSVWVLYAPCAYKNSLKCTCRRASESSTRTRWRYILGHLVTCIVLLFVVQIRICKSLLRSIQCNAWDSWTT